jgi:ribosome-associated protein
VFTTIHIGGSPLNTEALARAIADAVIDHKGLDVLILDLRDESSYADFLILVSGTSDRHVQALADSAMAEAENLGARLVGSEGLREGQWALVDFGSVVVHVFHQYSREVYDLEGMLHQAPRLPLAPMAVSRAQHH